MDLTNIKDALGWIGDKSGLVTQKIITFISNFGLKISEFQSKLINLIFIGFLIYLALKLLTNFKFIVKYGIIILLGILGISIIISFF